jgi:multimeric flavodoxin WrbA
MTKIRKGQPDTKLSKEEFFKVFQHNFYDPNFRALDNQIQELSEVAWKNYEDGRKAPKTVKAGPAFKDPDYDLSIEWMDTRNKLRALEEQHALAKTRILVINGSSRNEHTCPGEISKTYRLTERAIATLKAQGDFEIEFLDLSLITAQYGKNIHPCKACVSTAMPLCHWPCSCYPNHSLNQVHDWMAEIYEKWVAAHGILFVTPVHWYQAPSSLKLMIDRLVCADGGNPDPTSTHGKTVAEAKKIELKGWDYPKHLKNRVFAVYTHGDAGGAEPLRHALTDWLNDMGLVPADSEGFKDRFIGYMKPYATSHDDLDDDQDVFKEIDNTAIALAAKISQVRNKPELLIDKDMLVDPRPK